MRFPTKQRGAVLFIALIVLILVTLIGISGMKGGMMQLRMASNEETRVDALQQSQAAIDAVSVRKNNFVVIGSPGDVIRCFPTSDCTAGVAPEFGSWTPSGNDRISITRIDPADGPPPLIPGSEFSVDAFRATYFQIEAEHNSAAAGRGRSQVVQGYIMLIPN